jgi:hypothetical protein
MDKQNGYRKIKEIHRTTSGLTKNEDGGDQLDATDQRKAPEKNRTGEPGTNSASEKTTRGHKGSMLVGG